MRDFTPPDALKAGWRLFLNSWKPMAAYTLLVWVATLGVLSPVVAWVLNRLVAQSGERVVGNSDILHWLLSVKGLAALVLCGGLTLLGLLLQVTGLIRIAYEGGRAGRWRVKRALHWLLADLYPLLRFCLSAFLLCVALLLPLLACLGLIYSLLLGAHDINYYLSVRPPAWKWALALGGLCVLLWAAGAGILFLRWIYALPLWLDGRRPFRLTLADSWKASRRKFFFLLRTTLAYLALTGSAFFVLEGGLFIMAGLALNRFDQAVHALFFTISVYLVSAFILQIAISFIVLCWGTSTLVILYREHVTPDRPEQEYDSEISGAIGSTTGAAQGRLRPGHVLAAILVVVLSSAGVNAWLLSQTSPGKMPLVIAHRAGALHAPENSLAALEIAIRQGADYAEIDVQRSRDGVVVVIHDADLMKIARSPLRIRDTDFEDLAKIDIGREFHPDFGGERLARLSDFLRKADGKIKLMIELKYYGGDTELAKETIRLVRQAGMAGEVSLMSLELASVRQAQALAPDIPVGYLASVDLGRLTRLDVDFLAVSTREAQRALLQRAGRKHLPVYVWTVNEIDAMLAVLEAGADGWITDDPALAAEVLAKVTELSSAERLMLRFRDLWDPFR